MNILIFLTLETFILCFTQQLVSFIIWLTSIQNLLIIFLLAFQWFVIEILEFVKVCIYNKTVFVGLFLETPGLFFFFSGNSSYIFVGLVFHNNFESAILYLIYYIREIYTLNQLGHFSFLELWRILIFWKPFFDLNQFLLWVILFGRKLVGAFFLLCDKIETLI